MIAFNWKIVIIILVALVIADKALTVANLSAIKKNFPNVDPLNAEKNPIAKFFFQKFGLEGGTFLYSIVSLATALLFMFLLNLTLTAFKVPNSLSICLYVVMIFYGIVIGNNLFFLLKFSKVVP